MIRLLFILLFNIISLSCCGQTKFDSKNILKSKLNSNYIGGVNNYKPQFAAELKKYDYRVTNKETFLKAIKNAKKYQIIFIDGKADIDLSNEKTINIKTGIKIISDRGVNGSKGARLFTTNTEIFPLFNCGSEVSFSGLRIDGTDYDIYHKNIKKGSFKEDTYGVGVTQGIRSLNNNLTITNCEFSGWTHAAVLIKGKNAKISYSYFHHNRRYGLGYGICVDGGQANILGNLFDYNRHSIASTGVENSSYTVENNIFLENDTSHSVDVHGGKDRKDQTNLAGNSFNVSNNYFRLKENSGGAFVIRGIPSKKAVFSDNIIEIKGIKGKKNIKNEKYIRQINAVGNFDIKKNILK